MVLVSFYFVLLDESFFFSRYKKKHLAGTPLQVRCDAWQKPEGPLIGFCLRLLLDPERDQRGVGFAPQASQMRPWRTLLYSLSTFSGFYNR
jgi:hypothetical protein